MLLAAEFGTGQVLWSIFWFFLFFMWIWLVITIFADIIRNHEMGGWAKALWVVFVIFLPLLGVLVYLIVNGSKMTERQISQAAKMEKAQRQYIQDVAGSSGGSTADELEKLKGRRDQGVLTEEEFNAQKATLLA